MKIRNINPDDQIEWCSMRSQLWPDTPDEHKSETDEFFSGTSIDIIKVFILEVDKQIAGFIELNIRNFAEGSRCPKLPYVEAWFIKDSFRNKGYGTVLMRQAERWAIDQGYSELASDTEINNHRSISMHKSLGFVETERLVCFLKKLK